jgi:3,4-dihydroxy 2-butanone 4-phosphate synthase / GTP cyclohydrolase II
MRLTDPLVTHPRIPRRQAPRAVREALHALGRGEVVVLYDTLRDRADLFAAAELATRETIALLAREGGGIVAVALTPSRCDELGLREVVASGPSLGGNDRALPLVSIEARHGVSTGISAADRAHTIRTAAVGARHPGELVSPGHVFPVPAASGGLLERQGRIEAAVDAVRLAGMRPAAAICDLLDDVGGLGGLDTAVAVSERLGLARVAIADLAELRFECLWEGS